jgi:hypothetical protein
MHLNTQLMDIRNSSFAIAILALSVSWVAQIQKMRIQVVQITWSIPE